jgi:hypothetical protein
MDVYMSTKLHEHVVGRLEAEPGLAPGAAAAVFADPRRVHFFEPGETGMNLSLGTAATAAAKLSPTSEPAHALA